MHYLYDKFLHFSLKCRLTWPSIVRNERIRVTTNVIFTEWRWFSGKSSKTWCRTQHNDLQRHTTACTLLAMRNDELWFRTNSVDVNGCTTNSNESVRPRRVYWFLAMPGDKCNQYWQPVSVWLDWGKYNQFRSAFVWKFFTTVTTHHPHPPPPNDEASWDPIFEHRSKLSFVILVCVRNKATAPQQVISNTKWKTDPLQYTIGVTKGNPFQHRTILLGVQEFNTSKNLRENWWENCWFISLKLDCACIASTALKCRNGTKQWTKHLSLTRAFPKLLCKYQYISRTWMIQPRDRGITTPLQEQNWNLWINACVLWKQLVHGRYVICPHLTLIHKRTV